MILAVCFARGKLVQLKKIVTFSTKDNRTIISYEDLYFLQKEYHIFTLITE